MSTDDNNNLQSMEKRERVISGPIIRTVFALAIPPVLGMLMEFALSVTDFYWVGRLGASAQDAITSSMVLQWTIFSFMTMISVGVTALVSRSVGANEPERAAFYIRQAYRLAALLSLVVSVAGYILAPNVLDFMDAEPATMVMAIPYLRIFFVSTIFFAIAETTYASFRASGDTRTPFIIAAVTVTINMALDPLLIFGIGPFPELGVPGASLATAIAILVGMVSIVVLLVRGKLGYRVPELLSRRPDWRAMAKIARIGVPVSTQQLTFVIVYWFLIKIVHQFGDTAGAAMGIGNRMESFSYLTCYGFSLAASTMVGQNLGAKKPDRAERCAWWAVGLAIGMTGIMTALFLTVPGQIAGIFTDNPEVRKIAADYLFILGLSQAGMAVEIVLEAAFGGAGNTIPPMLVLVPAAILRVPLAYYLAFNAGWGINGVWWTLTFTTWGKALIMAFWFKLGRWKLQEV
jgi:putative MATE family efflux protein